MTMKMIFKHDLDIQVLHVVNKMQNRYDCIITLMENDKGSIFMDVFTKTLDSILAIPVSDSGNKDRLCSGIMGWFKANANYI